MTTLTTFHCRDCGTEVELDPGQVPPGWYFLPISQKWRCPGCALALAQANLLPSTSDESAE